jgi:hypothetical protein
MCRISGRTLLFSLLAAGLAAGCKPKPSTEPAQPSAYFATPFQNESQFVVEAIVSDLAEQMSYAASHRLPDRQAFQVTAREKPGSAVDSPAYQVRVRLGPGQREVKADLSINGPIWSPAVYEALAGELARAVGLSEHSAGKPADPKLLSKLTDGSPETIEKESQAASAALEQDFRNPELHEAAALVLGAFVMRDTSGHFYEIRSPLSRMTAHLAMARYLRGTNAYGTNGRIAEAMLLTAMGNQAPALERLRAMDTNDTAVAAMVRALWTFNTGDYRTLDAVADRSPVESVAWFWGRAAFTSTSAAWQKLSDEQKQTIDFVRTANQMGYSVEIGHELLAASLPLEMREIKAVYEDWHHKELARNALAKVLNELPERCFTESGGSVQVRVIGWGQWAVFFQRHLCHAVQQNFWFLNRQWGVPDQAREFAAQCESEFGALRLYPFVRRLICMDVKSYHTSVDDGFKVTVATPHLVPSQCWNELCYKVRFAPLYSPNPNPHINEWHNHNPLPGTVYDLGARLNHPSLVNRPDALDRFEKLRELAPYNWELAGQLLARKYHGHPTYDQAMALYGTLLPYSVGALAKVAFSVTNNPAQYEKLMLQAAELNPASYYTLAEYALERKQEDKAADYLEKACAADPDAVRVAGRARWRVGYYLRKGQTEKAREVADHGGEVYSMTGLEAKGEFLEATTNYDDAFEWFAKIEERYGKSAPVLNFCLRYRTVTGDGRFDAEVQKRLKTLFPKGIEKVAVQDLQGPPADGVLVRQDNDLLRTAGLKAGDVIVAVYGVRVHNLSQYMYGRDLKQTPELDLIVWKGDAYREFKPSPPRHLFGADFRDYTANRNQGR